MSNLADKRCLPYPTHLVPELALLDKLPSHLRKRFEQALQLLYQSFEDQTSWEDIASASSISPYHFHRQFTELFNETPGHYMNRLRLQAAVNLLMSHEQSSITNIAHCCGFSSSQALGKALKRELGTTAKQIRKMAKSATPEETAKFLYKLAHPGKEGLMELEIAQSMHSELIWYPKRGFKKVALDNTNWDPIFETFGKKSTRLLGITAVSQLEKSWDEIETTIGNWRTSSKHHDTFIPEGYFFCSDVYLTTDTAYLAALETLFKRIEDENWEIDTNGFLVEIIQDIELTDMGGVTFSFQVPIISSDT